MNEKEHAPFVRISWDEAVQILKSNLRDKYNAEGKLELKKDYGYGAIGDFYDTPTFVDIYLK